LTGRGKTTIRLAAVQARSAADQIEASLKHAEGLVEQAAGQGALMVVLPELSSCGYVPNRGTWDAAEAGAALPRGGWLQPGPWAGLQIIIPLDIAAGRLSYTISRQRRRTSGQLALLPQLRAPRPLLSNSYAMPVARAYTVWWKTSIAISRGAQKIAGGAMSKAGSVTCALPQTAAP